MTLLFQRAWGLVVGTTQVCSEAGSVAGRALNITFSVEKSTDRSPNKATIAVLNLAPATRGAIERAVGATATLRAGYVDAVDTIFVGQITRATSLREGPNLTTTIEATDRGITYRDAQIQRSFGAGTSVAVVLRAALEALGCGLGNYADFAGSLELTSGGTIYPRGAVLSGSAQRAVDRILQSCGLRWSIQDGVVQIRRPGASVGSAIALKASTGMIGSPAPKAASGASRDTSGCVVKTLLIPGVFPGRLVRLSSIDKEGNFFVRKQKTVGDSAGNDWGHELELDEVRA